MHKAFQWPTFRLYSYDPGIVWNVGEKILPIRVVIERYMSPSLCSVTSLLIISPPYSKYVRRAIYVCRPPQGAYIFLFLCMKNSYAKKSSGHENLHQAVNTVAKTLVGFSVLI